MSTYTEAAQAALGLSAAPTAVLKNWEILVSYLVPVDPDMAALRTAIASANSVEESAVTLNTASRRLREGRRLNTQVDVKISVTDAAQAKAVKTSAASVDALATTLGGSVTVKAGSEPAASAVIETVVKSDANRVGNMQNLIAFAGEAVGGTITGITGAVSSIDIGDNSEEVSTIDIGDNSEENSQANASVRASSVRLAALVLLKMVISFLN
jgi:hypothetical protein